MKKHTLPPINFSGESNLRPPQPTVPKGNHSFLHHFYHVYKKYIPKKYDKTNELKINDVYVFVFFFFLIKFFYQHFFFFWIFFLKICCLLDSGPAHIWHGRSATFARTSALSSHRTSASGPESGGGGEMALFVMISVCCPARGGAAFIYIMQIF